MKRLLILLLALVTCFSFVGCSKKYVTNVSALKISEALQRSIITDKGYKEPSESFLSINLGIPEHYIIDFRIVVANDVTNENEIGVFRSTSQSDATEIAKYCQKYLNNVKANFDPNGDPDEAEKVNNATVHIFGIYVVYTVLSPEDTDYALIVIDNLIAEGL